MRLYHWRRCESDFGEITSNFISIKNKHAQVWPAWLTIPYKKEVIPHLTSSSTIVQNIGACNCIHLKNGERIGYNTDVPGFKHSLQPYLQSHHQRAIVLGTGGASAAVVYVLEQLQIPYIVVSRKAGDGTVAYEDLSEAVMASHHLIINTTPLGTFPNITECPPIPYSAVQLLFFGD